MDKQNTKSKKKPSKVEEMSKEQIRQAILKKRECNAKAQSIVENLIEKSVSEDFFVKCLPDINQSHFEDVIEERSLIHLCGYPLCQKTLSENDIPKQKYRISLKTNKVYDITTRKNFCSNGCYKSAMHVKKQLLTSPLWFREYEEIPKICLMPMDSVGSMGQEIDFNLIKRIDLKRERQMYTSINDFASASLNEISEQVSLECNTGTDKENVQNNMAKQNIDSTKLTFYTSNIEESKNSQSSSNIETTQKTNINFNVEIPSSETNKGDTKKHVPNPLNIVGEVIEKPATKLDPVITNKPYSNVTDKPKDISKTLVQKKQPSITVITIEVEKCLTEWFTLDTMIFLFGEDKVKEMIADKGEVIKEYMSNCSKNAYTPLNTYDQYLVLYRKLNMLELEDRKQDSKTLQREMKPLPDYSIIQEESKKLELKVKAFFNAQTEITEPEAESSTLNSEKIENPTKLPLVDKNAQNALRRRIVCQHLNKVLPDLLQSLGLSTLTVSADIWLLVNTFKLKPTNIMFKPIQWTLIAIVFIKLLSIRDRRLEYLLEQPTGFQHMQLLLLSYKQDGGYLDRLISWLTDIDRMMDSNDAHLTIE